jgi:hypothetical protein
MSGDGRVPFLADLDFMEGQFRARFSITYNFSSVSPRGLVANASAVALPVAFEGRRRVICCPPCNRAAPPL